MNRFRRRARSLLRLIEAAVLVTVTYLLVKVLGDRRLMRLLGRPVAAGSSAPTSVDPRELQQARIVGAAVRRAAARLPFHPVCLPQSMAVRIMLKRRHVSSQLHLGVVRGEQLGAHSWVTVGDVIVQGGRVDHAVEVACIP